MNREGWALVKVAAAIVAVVLVLLSPWGIFRASFDEPGVQDIIEAWFPGATGSRETAIVAL